MIKVDQSTVLYQLNCRSAYVMREKHFTLAEVYGASVAFVAGPLGGITPVTRIDGRAVGNGQPSPVTQRVADLYAAYVKG